MPMSLATVLVVALLSACGAGAPQKEAANAEATLALWPMATSSDEARQQMIDGVHELDMARSETAYEHFKRAIAADPTFAMAELYASFAAFSASTLDAAFAHMNRAVELSKGLSEAERLIISAAKKNVDGDDDGALADAEQLVKVDPNSARAWDLLGFMYDAVRKRAEARAARDKAIELAPGYAGVLINQSASYAQTEPSDFVKAEEYARKAVELEPNDQGPYDFLGDALRAQGKLEEAAQAYTRCAELDPTRGDALQQRGHVQTFLGKSAEARADYDAAVSLATGNIKPGLAMYRSFVHLHEGNPASAVAELEQLYASIDAMNVPDPVGAKLLLLGGGLVAITSYYGMVPEAERAVARQTELLKQQMQQIKTEEFRRNATANIALGEGYLAWAKRDYAAMRQKAAEYMKIREPDRAPTKNVAAHVLLGYAALGQNRPADALAEFEQGNPDNILMVYHQALALDALRRHDDAQKLYTRLASYYFNPVWIGMVRRDALAKVKQPTA